MSAGAAAAMNPRTRALLEGAIVPTLLRLGWPNLLVMLAQAATGLIETWWVSHLGTDALAGMALVFPGFMMMQMLSGGAVGGGISSAVARALGGGRRATRMRWCCMPSSSTSRSARRRGFWWWASARRSTARSAARAHRSPPRSPIPTSSSRAFPSFG
jgi:hypothetical protein